MIDRLGEALRLCAAACGLLVASGAWAQAQLPSAEELNRLAPKADLKALRLALTAYQCASRGEPHQLLTVIDYSKPSRDKRLWVFDLKARKLLFEEWVAHGKNSGEDVPTTFSNVPNSYQSSLGLFSTGQTYYGKHGRSLRLEGLEPGINDNSMARAIVMHAAAYADPKVVPSLGRLGRSLGCPAVRPEVARMVVDKLKGGQFLFAWHPRQAWARNAAYFNCKPQQLAGLR